MEKQTANNEFYDFSKALLSRDQQDLLALIKHDQHYYANPINTAEEEILKPMPLPKDVKDFYAEMIDARISPHQQPYLYKHFMNMLDNQPNTLPKLIPLNKETSLPTKPLTRAQDTLITLIMDDNRSYKKTFTSYNDLFNKINTAFPKKDYPDHHTMLHNKIDQFKIDHAISIISLPVLRKNKSVTDSQKLIALTTLDDVLMHTNVESKRYCIQQLYDIEPIASLVQYSTKPQTDNYFAQNAYTALKTISHYNSRFTPQAYFEYRALQELCNAMRHEAPDLCNFSKEFIQRVRAFNNLLTSIISEEDQSPTTENDLDTVENEKDNELAIDNALRIISLYSTKLSDPGIIDILEKLSRQARMGNHYCLKVLARAQPAEQLLEYKTNYFFAQRAYGCLKTLSLRNIHFTPHAYTDYQNLKKVTSKLIKRNKIEDIPVEKIQQLKAQYDALRGIIPNKERNQLCDQNLKKLYGPSPFKGKRYKFAIRHNNDIIKHM